VNVGDRVLLVVGDRVLVRPEEGESVTNAGLILPASVAERESVQTGRVLAVGPGHAVPPPGLELEAEARSAEPRYVGMQARPGDLTVFSRKAAVEIVVEGEKLLVVPHGALLVLLRSELESAETTVN
jgi:co-chaperonin GroES (HSP10)